MTAAIRSFILSAYRDTLTATIDAADAVSAAAGSDDRRLTESPRRPLARVLEQEGVPERYAALLRDVRSRTGQPDQPPIVPAPPYVTTASTGPVLRLPSADRRLLIRIVVFEVDRDGPVTYRRAGERPDAVLRVRHRVDR